MFLRRIRSWHFGQFHCNDLLHPVPDLFSLPCSCFLFCELTHTDRCSWSSDGYWHAQECGRSTASGCKFPTWSLPYLWSFHWQYLREISSISNGFPFSEAQSAVCGFFHTCHCWFPAEHGFHHDLLKVISFAVQSFLSEHSVPHLKYLWLLSAVLSEMWLQNSTLSFSSLILLSLLLLSCNVFQAFFVPQS